MTGDKSKTKRKDDMKNLLQWILDRASERSTWIGLIGIATSAGIGISPVQAEAITTVGIGLAGAVMAFTADT
jgi:hypothetical protein